MRPTHHSPFTRRLVPVLALVVLASAACGGDDSGDAGATTGAPSDPLVSTTLAGSASTTIVDAATTASPDTQATPPSVDGESGGAVEGCGPEAVTDPSDRTTSRQIAHCDPGAPAPQPLSEPVTIQMRIGPPGEYSAPILLAESLGEFAKENLSIEYIDMPSADAVGQLAAGNLDAITSAPNAGVMNALGSGIELYWVLGNYSPPDGGDPTIPQGGIWVRRDAFSNPAEPDLCDLTDMSLANSVGKGTASVYWIGEAFESAGCSLADVEFDQIPPADQFTALEQGAVAAAFMLDPFWRLAADEPDDYALLAVQPREPSAGVFFANSIAVDQPEVGAAFARAYIRTINTYLQPGYKDDDTVVNALAEAIGIDAEELRAGDELRFEWEIRAGLTDDVQHWFTELESQQVPMIPEEEIVDRSIYLSVVGAEG